jgi:hypothetical protein
MLPFSVIVSVNSNLFGLITDEPYSWVTHL